MPLGAGVQRSRLERCRQPPAWRLSWCNWNSWRLHGVCVSRGAEVALVGKRTWRRRGSVQRGARQVGVEVSNRPSRAEHSLSLLCCTATMLLCCRVHHCQNAMHPLRLTTVPRQLVVARLHPRDLLRLRRQACRLCNDLDMSHPWLPPLPQIHWHLWCTIHLSATAPVSWLGPAAAAAAAAWPPPPPHWRDGASAPCKPLPTA